MPRSLLPSPLLFPHLTSSSPSVKSIPSVRRWRILTPRYLPSATVTAHLEFALRHEGVDLAVLNALFQVIEPETIELWVRAEPTGQYARRSWFLFEWLTGRRLDLPDAPRAPYASILDPSQQYATRGETVTRYRLRNNLPGTPDFSPLVRRTETLDTLLGANLADEASAVVRRTAPDLMTRACCDLRKRARHNTKSSFHDPLRNARHRSG